MNEIIRKDVISILSQAIGILEVKEEKNVAELRALSNHTIHDASVFQDECSISIAILIYSLSKIIERKQWDIDSKPIMDLLKSAKKSLEDNNFEDYNKIIKRIFGIISTVDNKLKMYIEDVIKQAQIKKGSKLHEHGISIARAAEVLGISQWELMNYIGKTKLTDKMPDIIDVRARIKFARSLFT